MAINSTNGLSLTQRSLKPVKGQAAYLPNQPIIHNCVVSQAAANPLITGDIVTFDTETTLKGLTVLKKAAATDEPIGVIVYNAIKSAFPANDRCSIFPDNSFVYLPAGAADIKLGTKLMMNDIGQVVEATSGNGIIGIAWTAPSVVDELIVVQIKPSVGTGA